MENEHWWDDFVVVVMSFYSIERKKKLQTKQVNEKVDMFSTR